MRANPRSNLRFDGGNVFSVVKEIMAYKIKSTVVKFFEDTSRKLLALNQIAPARIFQDKANFFKRQCITNGKIEACHVLIIPLNTTDENLFDFQERLIHLCYDLCGDYEPRICTIYDYLPADEVIDFNEKSEADILCNYVKSLSPIRVYLIGNELHIQNSVSKYFLKNELYNGTTNEYDEKLTFVENEPIRESIKMNLVNLLDVRQLLTNVIIKRLDQIKNDIEFPAALERVNVIIPNRGYVVNNELQQRAEALEESPIEFSASFHTITQAEYGATEHTDDATHGDINNMIRYDPTQPSS
ncbi:unnamed protein product [Rotaria sp. Silwood2]|nr:unnamed protein product [Rotaria sp. Silwood2]